MTTPNVTLPIGMGGEIAEGWRQLQLRWLRLPLGLRTRVWPGIIATLAVLALLLAFQQVVRGAVQQAESRRVVAAAHADATWRCNALAGPGPRQGCLAQLNAGPHDAAPLRDRNIASVALTSR